MPTLAAADIVFPQSRHQLEIHPPLPRSHWQRTCQSCGTLLSRETLERPLPCSCGRWTWD